MKSKLPENWISISFETIYENISISKVKIKEDEYLAEGLYPVIDQSSSKLVSGFSNDPSKLVNQDGTKIIFGDHTKAIKLFNDPFVPGADGIKVLDVNSTVLIKYAFYLLKSLKIPNKGYARHFSLLKIFSYPIAPYAEQIRIVQKIEELFSEIDDGIQSLETTQKQLNIHRQAILKSALYGELTKEWRKVNNIRLKDSNVLLNQYQKIRENDYLTKLENWKELNKEWEKDKSGVKPSKPSKLKKIVESSTNGINNFLELPKSWNYIRLGFLIEDPVYGTSKKCNYENNDGLGVLRIPNISKGFIDSTDLKFAYFSDEEINSYKLEKDDLLTIRSNGSVSLVGKTALVRSTDTDKLFAGYLIRLRPFKQHINGKYLHYAFESQFVRNQIELLAKSTSGVNNINSSELQSLIIPIPSLEEQNEIVNQLDNLLDTNQMVFEQLEVEIKKAYHLKSSILSKAFSGQLVPQDPNDEPASVLLERIKAEKEEELAKAKANKAHKKPTKRKTKATKEDEPAQQELI